MPNDNPNSEYCQSVLEQLALVGRSFQCDSFIAVSSSGGAILAQADIKRVYLSFRQIGTSTTLLAAIDASGESSFIVLDGTTPFIEMSIETHKALTQLQWQIKSSTGADPILANRVVFKGGI